MSPRARRRIAVTIALFLAGASAARAELHPAAEPVLARHLAVTGGREARENERTVRMKGHIEAIGLSGRWELWLAAPDRWMRTMTLGSLKMSEGWDGRVAWRSDLSNKKVTILSEQDLEYAREEGWFLNERWALADQGGGRIRAGSRSYSAEGDYEVLVITTPHGRTRRLFVNGKTGCIDRVAGEHDQYRTEERLAGHKLIGGRKRPTIFQAPTLLPSDKPIERMVLDSVFVNVPLDTARFSPPGVSERRIAWLGARDAVKLPFRYGGRMVWVKVSINGAEPADFILDTGASLTAVDKWYAEDLQLPKEGDASVQGVAGIGDLKFGHVRSMTAMGAKGAGVRLNDFRVGLIDMADDFEPVAFRRPAGLLGADFLSRFVVEIDYDARVVTLYDPATFRYAGAGAAIPMQFHQGIPVIDVVVNGSCTGTFLVDVGNSLETIAYGSLVRPCRLLVNRGKEVEMLGGGIGGGFSSTLVRVDSLNLGPFRLERPVLGLSLHTRGGVGSKDYQGNVGNATLEKFRCTFDYARSTLWLEPGKRYREPDGVSRAGVVLARVQQAVYVVNVMRGSAADEAGLRFRDILVDIDGRPAEEFTREEFDRVLHDAPAGTVRHLTIRRDTEEMKLELTLRDVL